ncbi:MULTISPECIES: hypothetical protein [unclassified Pseudomonas]|uniref:hypothetical protein n=1 Tax=unclassified Pseudomonas TaxID=196821 RepID=UPI002AC8B9E9|nr:MULTISPECIES: hypothetical protein [unclassified Pseudomonas]MEB0046402.1 hypothetical protein [Pseudomonas sp. Dout3]MEB0097673.1 hypothetical protein [Pseudomonas sp. DC1.2]WPX57738.1 hypothetical protein RHM68_19275 [Pseudomonas sp. DC1.2]
MKIDVSPTLVVPRYMRKTMGIVVSKVVPETLTWAFLVDALFTGLVIVTFFGSSSVPFLTLNTTLSDCLLCQHVNQLNNS